MKITKVRSGLLCQSCDGEDFNETITINNKDDKIHTRASIIEMRLCLNCRNKLINELMKQSPLTFHI